MTNVNWPEAVGGIVLAVGFFSWMIGKWPWEGIVSVHKHYHNPRKKKNEEERE